MSEVSVLPCNDDSAPLEQPSVPMSCMDSGVVNRTLSLLSNILSIPTNRFSLNSFRIYDCVPLSCFEFRGVVPICEVFVNLYMLKSRL